MEKFNCLLKLCIFEIDVLNIIFFTINLNKNINDDYNLPRIKIDNNIKISQQKFKTSYILVYIFSSFKTFIIWIVIKKIW